MNAKLEPMPAINPQAFTQAEFKKIATIAQTHFGLSLSESKISLIQSRLWKRMGVLRLNQFSDYLSLFEGPMAQRERVELLSVLTTNVTQFFREGHHFDCLRDEVLGPLIKAAQKGQRVRIWSAGCSTGQEAFSIAMTVLEMCPEAARLDIKILATDIDPVVIEQAKLGQFKLAEFKGISVAYLRKFVNLEEDGFVGTVKSRVKNLITFGIYNLIDPLPFKGPFDAIFCRNVAIYFGRETQILLWQKLVSVLGVRGYLFVGHSEHISGPTTKILTKSGVTTYRRLQR